MRLMLAQLSDEAAVATGTRTSATFVKPSRFRSRTVCMRARRLKNGSHSTPAADAHNYLETGLRTVSRH